MQVRPYISANDYSYVKKWIKDERTHALWCANLVPYPLEEKALQAVLDKGKAEWGVSPYVVIDEEGKPIGFYTYSVNGADNSAFLAYIILDSDLRGKGYGKEMMTLILKHAFESTGVFMVRLNVFDVNYSAGKCYESVGFVRQDFAKDVFCYKDEKWGRYHMIAKYDTQN